MNYHLQFRAKAMQQGAPILGRRQPRRFPLSARSDMRLFCRNQKPSNLRSQSDLPETQAAAPTRQSRPATEKAAETGAQVKELQFWLKVFSRFCQPDTDQEPS
jgi:hypothetical protein